LVLNRRERGQVKINILRISKRNMTRDCSYSKNYIMYPVGQKAVFALDGKGPVREFCKAELPLRSPLKELPRPEAKCTQSEP
jgi:hypothetical protein